MHAVQKQFHDFIEKHQLIEKGEKSLLAVSGGKDSMAMAHLFMESDYPFVIAHCNFGLRGKASDEDESFVVNWSKKNNVEVYTKRFDLEDKSIQLAARNARYRWFEELLEQKNLGKIATAHHINDSLETFLINLSRGSGLRGFTGIPIKSGHVIRPLLCLSQQQILAYAKAVGLKWREDISNEKMDYDRNLVRHKVVPIMEQLNPSIEETFARTLERLQLTADFVQTHVGHVKQNFLFVKEDLIELKLEWIQGASDVVLLTELLSPYGFHYSDAKEIFYAKGKPGKRFYSSRWEVSMDRESLFIKKIEDSVLETLEIPRLGTFDYSGFKIRLKRVKKSEVSFEDPNIAYFDVDKLRFPLKIRKWEDGDRFKPLGMDGRKKVSDFLVDNKVPVASKHKVNVLLSQDEIVWVISHRPSEDFKYNGEVDAIEIAFQSS